MNTSAALPSSAALRCPSCRSPMQNFHFPRKLSGEVELDLCFACQGIWFDDYESLQIAPGGLVSLFRQIHEHREAQRLPLAERLQCPRCDDALLHGLDRVKSGVFNYHRCLQRHGRFTTFAQFMIEKGFVRQLNGVEIQELKARIEVVYCTGCGSPVNIQRDAACGHCRSPLAILDPDAVERALAGYQEAERKRTEPVDPRALAEAMILSAVEHRPRRLPSRPRPEGVIGDLVIGGVELVWRTLLD